MFDDRYEVFLADSADGRRLHYRLRYQIYCEERGYEACHLFPNRLETDAADQSAVHFVVRSRDTGDWIATMRLVLPGQQPFPLEETCAIGEHVPAGVPRHKFSEISRLGIIRRRPSSPPSGETATPGRGAFVPEIMFGLFRAAYTFGLDNGFEHYLWLSTPSMVRLLKRFRLPMRPLGEACEFRGLRRPHVINVEEFWQAVSETTVAMDPDFHGQPGYRLFSAIPRDVRKTWLAIDDKPPYPRAIPGISDLFQRPATLVVRGA